MKNPCVFLLAVLISISSFAQKPDSRKFCGTSEAEKKFMSEHPELIPLIKQERENLERHTVEFSGREKSKQAGTLYIIPVVFHILHENGPENISENQVHDAMRILNEDYRKRNADSALTVAAFKGIASDSEIEFRLAMKDPNGNPTNGIDRIFSSETNVGDESSKLNPWPRNKYMNIWVVKNISSGAAGYTFLPQSWVNPSKDGIIVLDDYVGSIGTSSAGRDATLTHEVGHWLNLYHTWGDSNDPGLAANCNDDDNVSDTPNTIGWTSCNLNGVSCGSLDNVQNYMDYSYCNTMFTQGQSTRMRAALNSSTAQRNNLWTSSNLSATGVDILYAADFYPNITMVCANQIVKFNDASYYGQNNWTWSFNGGTPSSSAIQHPEITYSIPGLYDVSLTVTDGITTKSKTGNNIILVVAPDSNFLPFSEGFENITLPNYRWLVINSDNDANTFQQVNGVGFSGNSCVKLNNSGNVSGNKDELIVGSFDFKNMSSVSIKFKTAYAQKDTSTKDKLVMYASANCGQTWSPRYSKVGSALASAPSQVTPFVPTDTTQWKSNSATLISSMFTENVLIKFVFESDEGNDFFIDDINITGAINPVPDLKLPASNSSGLPDNIKLDWYSVTGVSLYQHELDTSPNFDSPLLDPGQHNYISNSSDNTDTEHEYTGLLHNQKYYWRVRTVTGTDTSGWSTVWNFTVSANGVGEKELAGGGSSRQLEVYPNPVTESSVILLSLNEKSNVSLEVYDIMGRRVSVIAKEKQFEKGEYQFIIGNNEFSEGLYLVKLTTGGKTYVRKFIVE